ncbi:glutaminase A [Bacillus piscicola]|uniref:glutaminase A n=1 Tax=Bacillus piscicola TaxID=1632684 RepID=UPI001F092B15|nr:glutaminase A [Bacillus piscicola]
MGYISETELSDLVEQAKDYASEGKVADYIPALKYANKRDLSIAMVSGNDMLAAGAPEQPFTLQSVSKILTFAIVLDDLGFDPVYQKVGVEPSTKSFNTVTESYNHNKPLNPMINAGALAVTNMISGKGTAEKLEKILTLVRRMAGNPAIEVNSSVASSEFETAHVNRALCYLLKSKDIITGDVDELMDLYCRQCAIEVSCQDLARIAYVLANNGVDPDTNEEILPSSVARIVTTTMAMCGMYNASGEFAVNVGVPAKSGVSGAILAVVPGKMGIGIYGPSLDADSISIAGRQLLQQLASRLKLSIFQT